MTIEITVNIPALDHFAQVLEGRDLAVLVDNFHRGMEERLDRLAQHRVEAATAAASAEKPIKAPVSAPEPAPSIEPSDPAAPAPGPAPAATAEPEPPINLADIRNACAALRDAGKLPAVQALLKETGAKNLSSLKPEQLPAFTAGLRELGARI